MWRGSFNYVVYPKIVFYINNKENLLNIKVEPKYISLHYLNFSTVAAEIFETLISLIWI